MSQLVLEGTVDYRLSYRAQIIQSLADFRREWQKLVEGKSLVEVQASVGLLLSDVADRLDFSPQERHVVLGDKLINQVDAVLEEKVRSELSA